MSADPTYAAIPNTRHQGGRVTVCAPSFADLVQLRFATDCMEAFTFISPADARALVIAILGVLEAQAEAQAEANTTVNQLSLPEAA